MKYLVLRLDHDPGTGGSSLIKSDEELDYLGDLYLANPQLHRCGISFERFLGDPADFLGARGIGIGALDEVRGFLRLLPAQRAVRDRLDAEAAGQQAFAFETEPQHDRSAA